MAMAPKEKGECDELADEIAKELPELIKVFYNIYGCRLG